MRSIRQDTGFSLEAFKSPFIRRKNPITHAKEIISTDRSSEILKKEKCGKAIGKSSGTGVYSFIPLKKIPPRNFRGL